MKKLLNTATILGFLFYSSTTPAIALDVNAAPIINSATGGSVSKSGTTTNVIVNNGMGGTSTYDWKQFNVGKDQTVNFQFNNTFQTALNKVQAAGGMSYIYGKLTNSGTGKDTGKVILLNPNGMLFGNGASVNLNSFTASTFAGNWSNDKQSLELTRNGNTGQIIVDQNAKIHGAEGVNLVAHNVYTHKGSLISTDNTSSWGGNTYGKVKLVTSDGINFQYVIGTDSAGKKYSNGAVASVSGLKNTSAKQMLITEGNINAGSVELVNASTHADSYLSVQGGSTIKATSAVKGENGSIVLTANSNVAVNNAQLTTANKDTAAAANTNYANYVNITGKNVSLSNAGITTAGNKGASSGWVAAKATNGNNVVNNSNINSATIAEIVASKVASVQGNSKVNGNTVLVTGGTGSQITNSTATARNGFISVKTTSGNATVSSSTLNATNGNIGVQSTNGSAVVDKSTVKTNKEAIIGAGQIATVQTNSNVDANIISLTGGTGSQISSSTATARNGFISLRTTNGNATVSSSTLNATNGNIGVQSTNGSAVVDRSTVKTNKDMIVTAGQIASVQTNSNVEGGNNVSVVGSTGSQITNSITTAKNGFVSVKTTNGNATVSSSTVSATNGNLGIQSTNGSAVVDNSTVKTNKEAIITAGNIASIQNKANIEGSNVSVHSKNTAQISGSSTIKSTTGYVNVVSTEGNAIVDKATITSAGNTHITAAKVASVQNASRITGNKVYIYGTQGSNKSSDSIVTERQ